MVKPIIFKCLTSKQNIMISLNENIMVKKW